MWQKRTKWGVPQGSILSPILANVLLHHVLDTWFVDLSAKEYQGKAKLVRYADDVVFTFASIHQAARFYEQLKKRFAEFGLHVNDSKFKVIICGKSAAETCRKRGIDMPCFTFLGFRHRWGISRNRKTRQEFSRIMRETCPKWYRNKLKDVKTEVRKCRHEKDLIPRVISWVRGISTTSLLIIITRGSLSSFAK